MFRRDFSARDIHVTWQVMRRNGVGSYADARRVWGRPWACLTVVLWTTGLSSTLVQASLRTPSSVSISSIDPVPAPGPFEIYLDPSETQVGLGPEGFDASLRIRGMPEEGLFSFGVKVTFPEHLLRVEGPASIRLPAELDFNGPLGAGALRLLGPGVAAFKGTVDLSSLSLRPFTGDVLATVHFVANDPTQTGTGRLGLEPFRTLGDTESIFVTSSGQVLDDQTLLVGGQFTVIPEPGTGWLLGAGFLAGGYWWNHHRKSGPKADHKAHPPTNPHAVRMEGGSR